MPRLKSATLEKVRARIQDAAQRLFIANGFSATSTRQIADAAGLTPGALYVHYESKEALFASLVERYNDRLRDPAENPLHEALARGCFPDDIAGLADAVKRTIARHRPYWLLWYIDVLEFGGKHFRSILDPALFLAQPGLKARLAQLRAAGRLRIDPALAFRMLHMHLFNYFLVESLFGGDDHYGVPEHAAVEAIREVFLNGMLAGAARLPVRAGAARAPARRGSARRSAAPCPEVPSTVMLAGLS